MYSITDVIYGIPLTEELSLFFHEMDCEPENVGFETLYTGSGDFPPGYLGVSLDGWDECSAYRKASDLKMQPTQQQKDEYQAKLKAMHTDAKELFAELKEENSDLDDPQKIYENFVKLLPEIDVYLIFSTS